jgi:hypothetical protein
VKEIKKLGKFGVEYQTKLTHRFEEVKRQLLHQQEE